MAKDTWYQQIDIQKAELAVQGDVQCAQSREMRFSGGKRGMGGPVSRKCGIECRWLCRVLWTPKKTHSKSPEVLLQAVRKRMVLIHSCHHGGEVRGQQCIQVAMVVGTGTGPGAQPHRYTALHCVVLCHATTWLDLICCASLFLAPCLMPVLTCRDLLSLPSPFVAAGFIFIGADIVHMVVTMNGAAIGTSPLVVMLEGTASLHGIEMQIPTKLVCPPSVPHLISHWCYFLQGAQPPKAMSPCLVSFCVPGADSKAILPSFPWCTGPWTSATLSQCPRSGDSLSTQSCCAILGSWCVPTCPVGGMLCVTGGVTSVWYTIYITRRAGNKSVHKLSVCLGYLSFCQSINRHQIVPYLWGQADLYGVGYWGRCPDHGVRKTHRRHKEAHMHIFLSWIEHWWVSTCYCLGLTNMCSCQVHVRQMSSGWKSKV